MRSVNGFEAYLMICYNYKTGGVLGRNVAGSFSLRRQKTYQILDRPFQSSLQLILNFFINKV